MPKYTGLKIALVVVVLSLGMATTSFFITETSAQNATQLGNQTGNQTNNQSSPTPAPVPGSTSQGSSGSSGPQY
jgi:hypothetical protein